MTKLAAIQKEIRSNPRFRILSALVLAILWGYGLILLRHQITRLAEEHTLLNTQLRALSADANDRVWLDRVEQAKKQQLNLERGLWINKTTGLAQAAWQDALILGLAKVNATRPLATVTTGSLSSINVPNSSPSNADTSQSTQAPRYQPLRAKVEFDFAPNVLHQWLGDLAKVEPHTIVESLSVRREPTPRVEAQLLSILLLGTAPEGLASPTSSSPSPGGQPPNSPSVVNSTIQSLISR